MCFFFFFANMLKQLYTYSLRNLKLLDTFTHDMFVIMDDWFNGKYAHSGVKRNHLKYQLEMDKSMNQFDSIGISSATVQ